MKTKIHKQAGFTLLELVSVIAITGILLAIGLPSYSILVKNNCMTTKANSFITGVQLARSEAVKRGISVIMRAKDNLNTPHNTSTADNEWGDGWEIVVDEDRNGNSILDPGEDNI